jgi:hypothetical protein
MTDVLGYTVNVGDYVACTKVGYHDAILIRRVENVSNKGVRVVKDPGNDNSESTRYSFVKVDEEAAADMLKVKYPKIAEFYCLN